MAREKNPYEATILLPRTDFPMRADLRTREPQALARWDAADLYGRIRRARAGRPRFLLHDGPPYANGPIHMGTALNKTLKDIVVRYKTMRGLDAPYVHGWDCHGLPIEHAVVKEDPALRGRPAEVRKRCRAFAERFVGVQRDAFVRLGCLGDSQPYLTMAPAYEAAEIEAIGELARRGHVYRDLKPIHWCPRCATALAEAEIEYAEKESHSITVAFPRADAADADVVIWTTTPWTLPANVAVAVHPDLEYVEVEIDGRRRLVAEALLGATAGACGWGGAGASMKVAGRRPGRSLEGLALRHPFLDREVKVILGTFVTTDSGTGCVHIAPGHGQEDYVVGARYGLPILSPVDGDGRFTPEAGVCAGRDVFEANAEIVALLRSRGALLAEDRIRHSYPHCWRCKGPVIFRATPQWFLAVDGRDGRPGLRDRALEVADEVTWIPAWGKDRFVNMLRERPDWCLSRQRAWGVPIPALHCRCGEAFIDEAVVRRAVDLVRAGGIDAWFDAPVEAVADGVRCPRCGAVGGADLRKETDILDVWFDSGVSWYAVVERRLRPAEEGPADLYLEGADQHRGWFQTSIWPSLALRDRAPYRTVLTHGWMLDDQGRAMHKSLGNAIDPAEVWERYGADVLRLWVSSEDYREDVRLSPAILDQAAETYKKIRNTWRFLLGALDGYDPARDDVPPADEIDRWILGRLARFVRAATEAYESFEFHRVHRLALEFMVHDLSAVYLDVRKDVLYCDPAGSPARRSARAAIRRLASATGRVLAPILPFTAEEVWTHLPRSAGEPESVHLAEWPETGTVDAALEARFERLLAARAEVQKALETARAEKRIRRSEEAVVEIAGAAAADPLLADLCLVAAVRPAPVGRAVRVERSADSKCPRCWRHRPAADPASENPLCARCAGVVRSLQVAR